MDVIDDLIGIESYVTHLLRNGILTIGCNMRTSQWTLQRGIHNSFEEHGWCGIRCHCVITCSCCVDVP